MPSNRLFGGHIRAIPVKGFSLAAVQTICPYLNLPIWCSVPNGDLVRCSWINFLVILRPGSDVSLRSSLPGNLPGGTHRGWQDVLLLFSTRTVVTCFPSNRTIFLVLALAKLIQHTARLGLPIPMLCLPSCSRRACILKGRHLVYAKLLPSGFLILIFLLLRIECMSFVFYSPNNPKRSSSLNPVIARVARRFWRKKTITNTSTGCICQPCFLAVAMRKPPSDV